jgi:hypothetical protein
MPDSNSAVCDQNAVGSLSGTAVENNQSGAIEGLSKTARREFGVMIIEILVLLISLAIAIAAFVSASAARRSANMAERSAEAAEATAKAAIRYSLTPLDPEIIVPFDAAKAIPEAHHTIIKFYNSGSQTVQIDNPVWEAQPDHAVEMSIIKVEVCLGQQVLFDSDYPMVPVFAGFTAKIQLKFALGYHFEAAGSCEGTLRFPIHPTLDNGSNSIEIPCKFTIKR